MVLVFFGGIFGFLFVIMYSIYFCYKSVESTATWLGGERRAEREFYREQGANFKTVWFYHDPNWRETKSDYDRIKAMENAALEIEQEEQEEYRKEEEQRKADYMKKLENW